jgi:2Fe-2S ferredoxin
VRHHRRSAPHALTTLFFYRNCSKERGNALFLRFEDRTMAKVTFIAADGSSKTVDAQIGSTVMEAAIKNGVKGIDAECGGACSCATCHVYVDDAWRAKVGPAQPTEEDMLDFASDVRENSRLSCQIKVTDDLDGLVVRTPKRQG